MSDTHRVQMEAPVVESKSLEEQAAAMDAAASESTENVESSEERPEWLPEKFKSAEEMAKAYGELESKQGVTEEPEVEPEQDGLAIGEKESEEGETEVEVDEVPQQQAAIDAAAEQFFNDGDLNEESYAKLKEVGISKELADQFKAGQEAQAKLQSIESDGVVNSMYDKVGGKEEYSNMASWAKDNLSAGELKAYDAMVNSGDIDQINFAVDGLSAKYKSNVSNPPSTQVTGMLANKGTIPYNNSREMTDAMQDPRYNKDAAYTKSVIDRVKQSNF